MKGVSLELQMECECTRVLSFTANASGLPMLKEVKFKCPVCGTGFYINIQEVKRALAIKFPDGL